MPLPALERFANDAATTTTADPGSGGTTLAVTSGAAPFPQSAQFRVRVENEIMIVTAGAGTTSWTVMRGAEGTAAVAHASGSAVTHIITAGALENYSPRVDLQRRWWMPDGALAEAGVGRGCHMNSAITMSSGQLRLGALVVLPKDRAASTITVCSSGGATSPTNQWFCLVRVNDLSVLRKTADDTTTAWSGTTLKTLSLSSSYTPSSDELVYVGVVVVASAVPTLTGWQAGNTSMASTAPSLGGNSTSGLTDPASLGATAGSVTGAAQTFWGYVS